MKKIISILFISLVAFNAMAQEKTIELEKFTQIKAYDRISVTLVKSGENKIVISGDDQDEVAISNKNGLLKIKMEFDNMMDGDEVMATLYYTEELSLLDANENAEIKSDQTFKGERIEIKSQEGGQIDLKVDLKDLYARSVSGGETTLTGIAKIQEAIVNTGGKIYNKELNTTETTVVVSAGGRADVKASQKVDAKVKAGGLIYIYGNPKDIKRKKTFGGKIEVMD
ncbi:hypothetical protein MNBD_BACTEROID03-1342 [hydrothermal vent metagenome]|uniref:Putative auto-transporter adhesin head GIN domain-containing protein n=1 Tax=hydrothermal vent metagenome TaxID=652676 RepID=A0A3B0TMX9_9ZZZZ